MTPSHIVLVAGSALLLAVITVPLTYWLMLAVASIRSPKPVSVSSSPSTRFAIVIPAHDEASVIANTVSRLKQLHYPREQFQIHIVADHCSDRTASIARNAGATVHERDTGPRTGKGAALTWFLSQLLEDSSCPDAIVIFDADTIVQHDFLHVMDARMTSGSQAVQGRHIISNPEDGWFPSLTWAMFIIDNRFQNLGRANLGWSAKNMGDSICLSATVLKETGWGEGLTEDYQLRQKLLLAGVRIDYEPAAIGYGEAPRYWHQAKAQRARWLRGTRDASQKLSRALFEESTRLRSSMLLDGALQSTLPSYSTLTLIAVSMLILHLVTNQFLGRALPAMLIGAWAVVSTLLFVYPLFGLALERAPRSAYAVIFTGPLFVVWRTLLALRARITRRKVVWVRTAHGEKG